jgi:lysophospholipase L1-like esterase
MKTGLQLLFAAALGSCLVSGAGAEVPWVFENDTRYLVMGDSLGAGYGAMPQTKGYAYRLYQNGTFDKLKSTLFNNASVIGVRSTEVAEHQLPQALIFGPDVVTLTVGGNDLRTLFEKITTPLPPDFLDELDKVVTTLASNIGTTLFGLCSFTPNEPISVYVGNLYALPLDDELGLPAGTIDNLVQGVNAAISAAVDQVDAAGLNCDLAIADVYSAFYGRTGLLLIERQGAEPFQIHPTNAGHKVIADAFKQAM